MGVKIVAGAFAASIKPLVQHGRALSKYFGDRHLWPSHLQADLEAALRRAATMTNSLSFSSSMLLFLESFRGCFGTPSGTEGPLLVKLPVEESLVKD